MGRHRHCPVTVVRVDLENGKTKAVCENDQNKKVEM